MPINLDPLFDAAGKAYNLDPYLIKSVATVESSLNPQATGQPTPWGRAAGVMQLIPPTASSLGVTDPYDPRQSIMAGARLLRQNLDRYKDPQLAIKAYFGGTDQGNWGPKTDAYLGKIEDAYQQITAPPSSDAGGGGQTPQATPVSYDPTKDNPAANSGGPSFDDIYRLYGGQTAPARSAPSSTPSQSAPASAKEADPWAAGTSDPNGGPMPAETPAKTAPASAAPVSTGTAAPAATPSGGTSFDDILRLYGAQPVPNAAAGPASAANGAAASNTGQSLASVQADNPLPPQQAAVQAAQYNATHPNQPAAPAPDDTITSDPTGSSIVGRGIDWAAEHIPGVGRVTSALGMVPGQTMLPNFVNDFLQGGKAAGDRVLMTAAPALADYVGLDPQSWAANLQQAQQDYEHSVAGHSLWGKAGDLVGTTAAVAPAIDLGGAGLGAVGGAAADAIGSAVPALGRLGQAASDGVTSLIAKNPLMAGLPARVAVGTVKGALGGGVGAAETSGASDQPLSDQIINGAEGGAIAGGALSSVGAGGNLMLNKLFGKPIDPVTAQIAQNAANLGLPVQFHEISGNPLVKMAGKISGDVPNAQPDVNAAVGKTFGLDTTKNVGNVFTKDDISAADQRIADGYNAAYAKVRPMQPDQTFINDLAGVQQSALKTYGPTNPDYQIVKQQVQNVADAIRQNKGVLTSDSYQALTGSGTPLDNVIDGSNPAVAKFAGQIKDSLEALLKRTNPPDVTSQLDNLDAQYKAIQTVKDNIANGKPGNVNPATLQTKANKSYANASLDSVADQPVLSQIGDYGQMFVKPRGTPQTGFSGLAKRFATDPRTLLSAISPLYDLATGGSINPYTSAAAIGGSFALNKLLGSLADSSVLRDNLIQRSLSGAPTQNVLSQNLLQQMYPKVNRLLGYTPAVTGAYNPLMPPPQ